MENKNVLELRAKTITRNVIIIKCIHFEYRVTRLDFDL